MLPDIIEAAKDTRVRDCFLNKVSFERLGIELDKMFEGNNPEISARQLYEFNLMQLLFKIPENSTDLQSEEKVQSLIKLSTNMAQVLGSLFADFKR